MLDGHDFGDHAILAGRDSHQAGAQRGQVDSMIRLIEELIRGKI